MGIGVGDKKKKEEEEEEEEGRVVGRVKVIQIPRLFPIYKLYYFLLIPSGFAKGRADLNLDQP